MAGDISKAAKGWAKLAHRFAKTISISDSFDAQLREWRVVFEEQAIAVTMRFGVGGFSPGMSLDQGLKQVDEALYAAKTAGRDRAVTVDEAAPR